MTPKVLQYQVLMMPIGRNVRYCKMFLVTTVASFHTFTLRSTVYYATVTTPCWNVFMSWPWSTACSAWTHVRRCDIQTRDTVSRHAWLE